MQIYIAATLLFSTVIVKCEEGCTSDFTEFSNAVFSNHSNLYNLTNAFYEPNRRVPLSVEVQYRVRLINNTEYTLLYDPECPDEKWIWVDSPIFLLMDPGFFNMMALYTLHYNLVWKSPLVVLYIPKPCNDSLVPFLGQTTAIVSWPYYRDACLTYLYIVSMCQ